MPLFRYVPSSYSIQKSRTRLDGSSLGRRAEPEIEAETDGIGRIADVTARPPVADLDLTGQKPDAGIDAEVRSINYVYGGPSMRIASPVWNGLSGLDGSPGNISIWRRIGNALADFHCFRGQPAIGGAIASIWLGPAGGQAAAAGGVELQELSQCQRVRDSRSLAAQLNISRNDADYMIRHRFWIFDTKQNIWVKNTTWNLFKMAAKPYIPYALVGGAILAALAATSGD